MLNDNPPTSEPERLLTALSFLRNNSWFKFCIERSFLMYFKLKMGFFREEKAAKSQYTWRFAVKKVIVNRFFIAMD